MEVVFTRNFLKILEKSNNEDLFQRIRDVTQAITILKVSIIKKLAEHKVYYRIKTDVYRIGIEKIENQIRFLTFQHRKDIYKKFP